LRRNRYTKKVIEGGLIVLIVLRRRLLLAVTKRAGLAMTKKKDYHKPFPNID